MGRESELKLIAKAKEMADDHELHLASSASLGILCASIAKAEAASRQADSLAVISHTLQDINKNVQQLQQLRRHL